MDNTTMVQLSLFFFYETSEAFLAYGGSKLKNLKKLKKSTLFGSLLLIDKYIAIQFLIYIDLLNCLRNLGTMVIITERS